MPSGGTQTQAAASQDAAELRAFMDELWGKLRVVASYSARLEPDAPGSVEWSRRVGQFWWQAREHAGVERAAVAPRVGMTANQLRLFEFGAFSRKDLTTDFLAGYATALDQPELLPRFREAFPQ